MSYPRQDTCRRLPPPKLRWKHRCVVVTLVISLAHLQVAECKVDGRMRGVDAPVSMTAWMKSLPNILIHTLHILNATNLIIMSPGDFDTGVEGSIWEDGITTEIHRHAHLSNTEWTNSSSSVNIPLGPPTGVAGDDGVSGELFFPSVNWRFLYERVELPRHQTVVLVLGPASWVLHAAPQLASRGVFGPKETVVVAPVSGELSSNHLSSSLPLALRLLLLQETPQANNEITVEEEGGKQVLKGYLGRLLTNIMKKVNFVPRITARPSTQDNVDALASRETDVVIMTLSMLPARAEVMEFSEWYWIHNTKFVTKVPGLRDDSFLLFQIYLWQTWCVITGLMVVSATVLAVTWSREHGRGQPHHLPTAREKSIRNTVCVAFTTSFKTIIFKSSKQQPGSAAGRVVLTATWLVAMVVVAVYTGNLTAFLSIPRVDKVPNSVRDLLDMGYTLNVNDAFSQYQKMKQTSPIPDQQRIFKKAEIRSHFGFSIPEVYINRTLSERLALLVNNVIVDYLLDHYTTHVGSVRVCRLKTSTEPLFLEIGGFGFPKNSLVKPLFDDILVWARSTRLVDLPHSTCVPADLWDEEGKALSMGKMGGVFVLWAAGVGVACLAFLAETVFQRLQKV
ncbi:glutamate receptor ionotropic, delta-1-like isoform X4 [Cherax quadricarinatus]|uniref:glutamate receptor ionotropic, delta-1-like isoform X4 n=1 Tax=Cherax quadricarinatus TaxID=27406 RepID=UPI0023784E3D|nr:glutamate receptor ionotropic, delta-1-like isoform X1 [Cherax quadricarinatus]